MKDKKYALSPEIQLGISVCIVLVNSALYTSSFQFIGPVLYALFGVYRLIIAYSEAMYDIQVSPPESLGKNKGILQGGYNPMGSSKWLAQSTIGLFDCVFTGMYQGGIHRQLPRIFTMGMQIAYQIIVLKKYGSKFAYIQVVRRDITKNMFILLPVLLGSIFCLYQSITFYGLSLFSICSLYFGYAIVRQEYTEVKNIKSSDISALGQYRMKNDVIGTLDRFSNMFAVLYAGKWWLLFIEIPRIAIKIKALSIAKKKGFSFSG